MRSGFSYPREERAAKMRSCPTLRESRGALKKEIKPTTRLTRLRDFPQPMVAALEADNRGRACAFKAASGRNIMRSRACGGGPYQAF